MEKQRQEAKGIYANAVERYTPRKKREDVSGRAKRPGNRTVYGRN